MLHHCLRIILLVVTLIGIVTSQDNNLAGDEDKIGPLQMSRTQLVVAVTFPSAILVGILFCLCLTKSLGIDSWQSKHNKVEPKKIPPKATTQPKRTPRFSPTNSRVSSSSTGTSASYKHYSC